MSKHGKVKLEFTLCGHKHTYFKRYSIFGNVITTMDVAKAKWIKETHVQRIVKHIRHQYGMHSVEDVNIIQFDAQKDNNCP